jgi:hypothetical protein
VTSDTNPRTPEVWVVASGNASRRDAVERFFREAEICAIGPGRPADDPGLKPREAGMLREFQSIKPGDVVLLSGGVDEIRSVGVAGEPTTDFGIAIASWDLGHVVPVNWLDARNHSKRASACLDDLEEARDGRRLPIARFARLGNERLRSAAMEVVSSARMKPPRSSRMKPPRSSYRAVEAISSPKCARLAREVCPLIDSKALAEVLEEAGNFGTDTYPRLEADTVAMIIVPLLRALGVSSERIRVEVPIGWIGAGGPSRGTSSAKRVDVVVFDDATTARPRALVEAKRRWQGLDDAKRQVDDYAHALGQARPPGLIVTDGAELEFEFSEERERRHANLSWRTRDLAEALADLAAHLAAKPKR